MLVSDKIELYKAIKKSLILLKVIGLAFYTVKYTDNKIYFSKIQSRTNNIICIIIHLIAITIIFIVIQYNISEYYVKQRLIYMVLVFGNVNAAIIIPAVYYLSAMCTESEFITTLNELLNMDELFWRMGKKIQYSGYKRYSNIALVVVCVTTITKIGLTILLLEDNVRVLRIILLHTPLVFINFVAYQWILYLNLTNKYFKSLNDCIKKGSTCALVYDKKTSLRNKLETAMVIYDKLYNICVCLNDKYSAIIFTTVGSLFCLIIKHTFKILHEVFTTHFVCVPMIFNTVIYIGQLFCFVLPCIQIQIEAGRLVRIVNNIEVNVGDETTIGSYVRALTIQTYYQKIKFEIWDTFQLDGTLIYSIFGATTTYLVILLQFDT